MLLLIAHRSQASFPRMNSLTKVPLVANAKSHYYGITINYINGSRLCFFHRDQAILTNCLMKKVYVESMYNGLNMRASLYYRIIPHLPNNSLFVFIC